jgi:hypothetical protein
LLPPPLSFIFEKCIAFSLDDVADRLDRDGLRIRSMESIYAID